MILKREGTLVVRPDSGDPPIIVPQLLDLLGRGLQGACYHDPYRA